MTTLDTRLNAIRPDLADERLRGRVTADRYVAGRNRRVMAPSAPLRRRPAPDAPLETEALMGEDVAVFDEHQGYAWVQLARDGYVGYLPGSVLSDPGDNPTHRVTALRTFIYPEADLKRPPTGFLSFGARVTARGAVLDGYLPVATGGFVFAGHLGDRDGIETDFVTVAERFLGTPYLWGGRTSLGIDCSGLVQIALEAAGRAAPRDSDLQETHLGRALDRQVDGRVDGRALGRGDLVFWRGHVGIMLDGERLIHANGHHMAVAVEPLAEAERRVRESGAGPITGMRRMSPT